MSSKLSEAQDAFFQAFAAMPRADRVLFAKHAAAADMHVPTDDRFDAFRRAARELLALSDAIHEEN